jgi:deoxyribonuclease-4
VRFGAHIGTRGGLRAADRTVTLEARAVGAELAQVFLSSPRAWAPPDPELAGRFGEGWRAAGIGPLYVHAPYLVNIASPTPEVHERSRELALATVRACEAAGAAAFVVHAGSGGRDDPDAARARSAAVLRELVAAAHGTRVLVELMAGTAGAVASTLPEARRLLEEVGDDRLGLCLDTCHLFAAGYALDEPAGVEACFAELHRLGLADRLGLVHANDAKHPRGSQRDRHERIGEGHIGVEGFFELLHRPELAELDLVLETPADREQRARELATLRRLAS